MFVVALLAGCSSNPKPPPGGYSPLPPDHPTPRVGSATPAGTAPAGSDPAIPLDGVPDPTAPVISFPAGGPPCMPAGDYTVAFDFSAALFTVSGGMDQKFCEAMAEGIATKNLTAMRISFDGGTLAAEWPQPQTVIVRGECDFEIVSRPAPSRISFEGGVGTGSTSYTLGTPNHPSERCDAKNVKLTITR